MNTQSNHAQNPFTVCVENVTLPVIVHQDARVITTELLAQVYNADINNIQLNYSRNKDRFEEGKHFFKIAGDDLKNLRLSLRQSQIKIDNKTRSLILWTARGAARHAKMLDTDQAWEVFDKLEAAYFEQPSAIPSQELPKPEKPRITHILTTLHDGHAVYEEVVSEKMRVVCITNVESFCDFILHTMPMEFAPEVFKVLAKKVIGSRVVGGPQ